MSMRNLLFVILLGSSFLANANTVLFSAKVGSDVDLWGYNKTTGQVGRVFTIDNNSVYSGGGPFGSTRSLIQLGNQVYGFFDTAGGLAFASFDGEALNVIDDTSSWVPASSGSFIEWNGKVYFIGNNGTSHLFEYDPAGGSLTNVTGNSAVTEDAYNARMVVAYNDGSGEKLYFAGRPNSSQNYSQLYRYDGSVISAAPNATVSNVGDMIVFNGELFMSATPAGGDNRLMKYDGSSTTQVSETNTNTASFGTEDFPGGFIVFNNKLYFYSRYETGTVTSSPGHNNYYSVNTSGSVVREYGSGTYGGYPQLNGVSKPFIYNGDLYFTADVSQNSDNELIRLSASGTATSVVATSTRRFIESLTFYENGAFFFQERDSNLDDEPYYYDLAGGTLSLLGDLNPGAAASHVTNTAEGTVVFSGTIAPVAYHNSSAAKDVEVGAQTTIGDAIEVYDVDTDAITTAVVSFESGFSAGDILAVTDSGGISSSYNGSTGVLTLTSAVSATASQFQTVLRTLSLQASSEGSRTLLVRLTDTDGLQNDITYSNTARLSAKVIRGQVVSIPFSSKPAGLNNSSGSFVGEFTYADPVLGNIAFKATDDSASVAFESLSLSFNASDYGLIYSESDGELHLGIKSDFTSARELAFKAPSRFVLLGFDAIDRNFTTFDRYTVTGFLGGVQQFQESIVGSNSSKLTYSPSAANAATEIDELRINPSFNGESVTGADFYIDNISLLVPSSSDSDGNLTAGAGVTEPVSLDTTADTILESVDIFDFTLSDGGTNDGLPMAVSQVVVNVSGTSTDTERAKITWRLNGPDASNVTGTYSAAADTITFPGLSISVADGASETYTINAYYNDNRGLTEDNTIILSVDGDTDLTVESSGTQMGGTSSVHNGTGTAIDVVATQLAFVTQPAGSTSGSALSTQPVVAARDAFGNTDVDFSETITLTESSAGALSNSAASSVSGVATFTGVIYTATSDQESFTLIANDQDSVGSDLVPVNANAVTSDVVATKLLFDTQPSPASVTSGSSTAFTTVPVIRAVDASDITDTGYSTNIMIAEINGAGSATMTGTGDLDGDGSTVTLAPGVGVATFTGLQITYTASGASNENFNLQASSGGLSSATSTQLTASVTPTITSVSVPANATYVAGQNLDVTVNTSGAITVNTAGGTPRIMLDIGGSTAYASYLSGSGTNSLAFRYTLQSGDLDTDGIGIATLDTNGGTLQNSSGNDLDTTLNAVGSTAAILVDAVNPTVSSVTVPSAGRYVAGNNLDFTLNVSENLTLNTGGGVPRIALTLGSTTRYASYISGSGTASLVFRYVVQSGDEDTDGVTVAAAVDSNGGTLKDAAGNDLVTTLNAVGDTSAILVDTVAPAGHSVTFDDSTLNAAEAASASFTFIAAEVGTDYSYTISSTGGGTPLTGSGTVATASDQITGVDLSGLADGTLTLSVTLTDTAGNSAVAVTDTATLDVTAATVTLSTVAPAVTNAAFEVAIVFSEAVDGFVVGDVTAVNAALSGFTGSGANYSVTVTPSNDGVVTVDVASGVAQDAAGNTNVAATQLSRVFDGTAPAPVISTDANALTNGPINLTINFGEVVSGFVSGDLSVTNGNVTAFTDQGGGVFDLTVEAAADGNVVLSLPAAVADDEAGNASIAATPLTIAFDGSGPTLQSSSPSAGASAVSYQSGLTLTFDEPVFAVSGDLVLQDATDGVEHTRIAINGAGVVIVGAQVEVTLEKSLVPTHDYYVTVASGSLEDEAGNAWGGIQNDTTLSFTVGNEAPQANNDTATISQDQSVAIDLLANDTDLEGDLSPASVRMTTAPFHGQVTINTGTGVAIYTPEPGFNGSDSFAYVVEDQYRGQSAAATVAVNVVAEVRAPVARADVANGVPGDIVVLDLLANDSPGIGGVSLDNVTLTLINRPLNGTAEIANGELTYVPEEGFGGIEQLRYSLTDPDGRVSNVADVWINLSDSNQPPVTLDDSAETPAGTTLTLDILANDSDSEGALDPSSVGLMSLPAHGSVNLDEVTGRLTYAPDAGFRGEDRLTYVVRDAEGLVSPVAEVILAVGTNEAPVARDDQVRLVGDKVHAISVLGNDGNGSASLVSSSLRVVNTPLQGSVTVDAALGLLLYTPDAGFTGTDELTYTVEDDQGRVSAPAIVRIGSGIVNNVPVANPDRFVLEEDSSLTLDLLTNDQDLEAGLSRFDIVLIDTPRHGSVSVESDGTLIYSPDQHVFGEDRLTYRVSDAQGGESRVVSARLRITPKADVPLISGTPTRTVTAEEAYRFTPVVKDIDGNPLQFSILNKPIWATFDDTTGRLSGTPGVAQVGVTEGIVISVSNGDESASLPAFDLLVADNSGGDQATGGGVTSPAGPGAEEDSPVYRVNPDDPQLSLPESSWPATEGEPPHSVYRVSFIDANGDGRTISVTQGANVAPPLSSGPNANGELGLEFSQADGSRQTVSIGPDGETELLVFRQAGDASPVSRLTSRAPQLDSEVREDGRVVSGTVIERTAGGFAKVDITQSPNAGVTVAMTIVAVDGTESDPTLFQFDLVPADVDLSADGVVTLQGQTVNGAGDAVVVSVRLDARGGMTVLSSVDDGVSDISSGIVTESPGAIGGLDAAGNVLVTPSLNAPANLAVTVDNLGTLEFDENGTTVTEPNGGKVVLDASGVSQVTLNDDPDGNGLRRAAEVSRPGAGVQSLARLEVTDVESGNAGVFVENAADGDGFAVQRNLGDRTLTSQIRLDGSAQHRLAVDGQPANEVIALLPQTLSIFFDDRAVTVADQNDATLYVEALLSGEMRHEVVRAGNSTRAISRLPGSRTQMEQGENGAQVITEGASEGRQITVIAREDGSARHQLVNRLGHRTRAEIAIPGTATDIAEDGGLISRVRLGSSDLCAWVETFGNGETSTGFGRYDAAQGSCVDITSPTNLDSAFESGNAVSVEESDGYYSITVEADVTRPIRF